MTIGAGVLKIGVNQCIPEKTIWLTNTPPEGYEYLAGRINYVSNDQYSFGDMWDKKDMKVYPYQSSLFSVANNGQIGDCAFQGCTSLETLTIGEDVTSLGSYAFNGCKSLKEVKIPNKVQAIGESCFVGDIAITILPFFFVQKIRFVHKFLNRQLFLNA